MTLVSAWLDIGSHTYTLTGTVHLGTTGPAGADPTVVESWACDELSCRQLIDLVYDLSMRTRLECEEAIEQILIDEARAGRRGVA